MTGRLAAVSCSVLRGALVVAGVLCADLAARPAAAATFGPPLLDITQHCSSIARRNVAAMSECIVAESEARAEILQKWAKFSDANADRCVKLGRKARKYPYAIMAKCLDEPAVARPAAPPPVKEAGAR